MSLHHLMNKDAEVLLELINKIQATDLVKTQEKLQSTYMLSLENKPERDSDITVWSKVSYQYEFFHKHLLYLFINLKLLGFIKEKVNEGLYLEKSFGEALNGFKKRMTLYIQSPQEDHHFGKLDSRFDRELADLYRSLNI